MKTVVKHSRKFPQIKNKKNALLIYDQYLLTLPNIQKWIESFPQRYSVKSGESLKNVQQLPKHLENLSKWIFKTEQVYVLGGGSVGDFGGFVASILRRGIPVIQIPSTWLAALDSAHGGKTALNVGGFKNQVGTFHFPQQVWIVQSLLEAQPPIRLIEASGEFMKTALLGGEKLLKKMQTWDWKKGKIRFSDLKAFIAVKYAIVQQDPMETKGIRYQLNLGHTLGHVWEAHFGIPHGLAIFHGLLFDLAWSVQKKMIQAKRPVKMMDEMPWSFVWDLQFHQRQDKVLYSLSESKIRHYLIRDKKIRSGKINFTFVTKPGKVVVKQVLIDDVLREYRRQQRALQELYENL